MNREMLCFDLETTGIDVWNDRTVTAFLGTMDNYGKWVSGKAKHWVVDSGMHIPEGASAVHGWTDEMVALQGEQPLSFLAKLHRIFQVEVFDNHKALVVYNASYDLTLINEEFKRVGLEPFSWWSGGAWIIDPLVIDKAIDMYRPGKRTLTVTSRVYGVPVEENAHDASADCLMAGRIALAILNDNRYANKTPQWWMEQQRKWKEESDAHYESYRRGKEKRKPPADQLDPEFTTERGWPVRER